MFVHQDLLGHPDYAELPDFQVIKEEDRIYIENIPIFQPVAHSGSDKSEGTTYVYRKEVYQTTVCYDSRKRIRVMVKPYGLC